jgi:hypothetical protein
MPATTRPKAGQPTEPTAPALSYGYEPDRVDLIAAASRRHELARSKAIRAVRELDAAGATVAFESVARAAGVSRSWLYTPAPPASVCAPPRRRRPAGFRLSRLLAHTGLPEAMSQAEAQDSAALRLGVS